LAASDGGVHVWQMLHPARAGMDQAPHTSDHRGIGALSVSRISAENKRSLDRANVSWLL
jgi:hypothetical protein